MAQDPWQVDQIQIEPGTSGTRKVNADDDGYLQFTDPNVTAHLLELVGLRNVTGVFIVGRAGDGAAYTAVQDAIDDIPDSSSADAPSLVVILSGAYTEDITIAKDGVYLVGLGAVTLENSSAGPTITIEDDPITTPETVVLQNLRIVNDDAGEECIYIVGSGTYASGTVTVGAAPLSAGDTITIGGVVLTGVSGDRTSGSDDFSVDGTTVATVAAEIVAAINDSSNSFAATVEASYSSGVVTITAVTAGAAGNSITLAVSAADLTASGANLSGGGSSGSLVASDAVIIKDCDLIASGVGAYQIVANTVNNVWVYGGTWRGSASTSICQVTNCAQFYVDGVEWTNDFELSYDTANDQPDDTTSEYRLTNGSRAGDLVVDLDGEGSLSIGNFETMGAITMGGDQTLAVTACNLGNISLDETVAATLINCTRGTLTEAGGTPTLAETLYVGSQAFAASASEAITFDIAQPDASYMVVLDCPEAGTVANATAKAASGFIISLDGAITGTVYYSVLRQM